MPKTLSLDLETCCGADLRKVGASKYSKDPSLIVTVIAWAFDDGPVASTTCVESGERVLPAVVEDHLRRGGRFNAWNSSFETAVLVNYFGVPIAAEQVSCTMQRALHAGLPGALGDCGPALGLSVVKDKSAHRLMMQMARPKLKGGYWHETNPEKLAALRAYCERDVDAEREIAKHIPELPPREELISQIDRAANQRGLRISTPLVERMLRIADEATEALDGQVEVITDGEVVSSGTNPARMMAWLNKQGCPIDSLTKGAVSAWLLRDDLSPAVRRVLELRQMAARSSVKKLVAMLNAAEDDDDAVRGALAYYGASRTGRWCLAGGSLVRVMTSAGIECEKPIEDVLLDDLVWDGSEWVSHEGVVFSGEKEVIEHDGVTATPEHVVYLADRWQTFLGTAKEFDLKLWRGNGDTRA